MRNISWLAVFPVFLVSSCVSIGTYEQQAAKWRTEKTALTAERDGLKTQLEAYEQKYGPMNSSQSTAGDEKQIQRFTDEARSIFKDEISSNVVSISSAGVKVSLVFAGTYLFGPGETAMKAEAEKSLSKVQTLLREYRTWSAAVVAYPLDWKLSEERAKSVEDYFLKHGARTGMFVERRPVPPQADSEEPALKRLEISFFPNRG